MTKQPLIGLVVIGRNEEAVISRCLLHALPLVDTVTYCDTGSTDSTVSAVRAICKAQGTPVKVYRHKWQNFAHNLNMAHERAKGTAKWLLWLHADMSVRVSDDFLPWLRRKRNDPDYYRVEIRHEKMTYPLPLLMRGDLDWRYIGATHEYLETGHRSGRLLKGIWVEHEMDGTNRADKFERDIELLRPEFRERNGRAIFYTAQSHLCLGHNTQAALIYDLRASMNGWEEERWYSEYMAAKLREDVEGLIECWRKRPWRHEPLTAAACLVAAKGALDDVLFLERPPI